MSSTGQWSEPVTWEWIEAETNCGSSDPEMQI